MRDANQTFARFIQRIWKSHRKCQTPTDKVSFFLKVLLSTFGGSCKKLLEEADMLLKSGGNAIKPKGNQWVDNETDVATAIDYYNRAVEFDARNPVSFGGRADCYHAQGKYELAIKDYERVSHSRRDL
jgi:tetratricopeptide (TPR) repeat protein